MVRLLWIVLLAACQPLGDATGGLAAHGDGKRIYFKMALSEVGVRQDITSNFDKIMPTKIHALRYTRHYTENLQLTATQVNFNSLINLANVIFSWKYKESGSPIYTCHLHTVSLGEQRDVIAKSDRVAPFCFEQQVTSAAEPAAQGAAADGNYVHLLAEHCVKASGSEGSRFIFLEGKDFACDLSAANGEREVVLQASCLAKGDDSCLSGDVRVCATQTAGFENFIAAFKARVDAPMNCNNNTTGSEDNCTITYGLETPDSSGVAAAITSQTAAVASNNQQGICAAFAVPGTAEIPEDITASGGGG